MDYMFFWSLFFVLSTTVCQFGYIYGGVDRTFRGLNKGAAEAAMDITKKDSRGWPCFQSAIFVEAADAYFAYNLKSYLSPNDYKVTYAFLDEAGQAYSTKPEYCSGFTVTFKARIMDLTEYRNQVTLEVKKGEKYD
jgi:hypothetical protein